MSGEVLDYGRNYLRSALAGRLSADKTVFKVVMYFGFLPFKGKSMTRLYSE